MAYSPNSDPSIGTMTRWYMLTSWLYDVPLFAVWRCPELAL
jgi:hypothetical protein